MVPGALAVPARKQGREGKNPVWGKKPRLKGSLLSEPVNPRPW